MIHRVKCDASNGLVFLKQPSDLEVLLETFITVNYGLLYNWMAAYDSRNIANTGWHVITNNESYDLMHYLDPSGTRGSNVAGNYMKETGTTYWSTTATGVTNSSNFNGRGAGLRTSSGTFSLNKNKCYFWNSNWFDTETNKGISTLSNSNSNFTTPQYGSGSEVSSRISGHTVRLVKDSTTLTNGETGFYTGNDGKLYRTICIGSQEWLADNLQETKFRNGDTIPEITGTTEWASTTGYTVISPTYGGSISSFAGGNSIIHSQSFTVLTGCNINYIILYGVSKSGSPNFDIRLSIYNESSDLPTTKILDSTNVISATSTGSDKTFLFGDYYLAAGKYCFVTSYENVATHDNTNNVSIEMDTTNPYSGGQLAYKIGSGSWTNTTYDAYATVFYGMPALCAYDNDWNNV